MATVELEGAGRLFYRESTDRAPAGTRAAVLVHRAGGSSRGWEGVLERVGAERRLVALDLPGHGGSPGRPLGRIELMAEVLIRFVRALGLETPLLGGHSMGGAVALEAALRSPGLAGGLLLVASGARLRVAEAVMAGVRDNFEALPQLMGQLAFSPSTPRARVDAGLGTLFDAPREVVLADLEACDLWDAEDRVGGLETPVTLLAGRDDLLTPPRLGRRLLERAPRARMEVLEDAGHMIPDERPDAVARAVLEGTVG